MKSTGFLRILTVILVTLKLTELIRWEWVWVLSPLWISALLYGTAKIIEIAIRWSMK